MSIPHISAKMKSEVGTSIAVSPPRDCVDRSPTSVVLKRGDRAFHLPRQDGGQLSIPYHIIKVTDMLRSCWESEYDECIVSVTPAALERWVGFVVDGILACGPPDATKILISIIHVRSSSC